MKFAQKNIDYVTHHDLQARYDEIVNHRKRRMKE